MCVFIIFIIFLITFATYERRARVERDAANRNAHNHRIASD